MVPNRAWEMPTPHRMKYFQPASRLAGVRYRVTSSTVDRVAASIATHMSPMLLVVSAISMVAMNSWYMLWYRRSWPPDTRPCSASMRM